MEETKNSHELDLILSYMNDILINEFPTNILTQEYLVTAILDNKQCHANMFLGNLLISKDIENLRNVFISYLREHSTPRLDNNNIIKCDPMLQKIINNAKNECNSTIIGTEHILLSMLNPINENNKMIDIFKSIGINYDVIKIKYDEKNKFADKIRKTIKNKSMNIPNMIPLKSDIKPKALINKTTYIQNYTIDLNKMADEGKIDDLIGRENEMSQIIKILARRKKNNVVLVGKGGVGKTALILGLAKMIQNGNVPDVIKGKRIVQLNVASLIAGTYLRGAFEERVKGLFDEMKSSNKYILFIDDIHTVLKTSSKERDTDISSMINDVLAEGDIKVIGATSFKDYRNSIENNTMISRRLQKIVIEPSSKEETISILHKNKHYYEEYHHVKYNDESIEKCVELAERYITDRSLPDSAIDVLDFSGAHTCLVSKKPSEIRDIENQLENLNNDKTTLLENGDFEGVDSLLKEENELKYKLSELEREYQKNSEKYTIEIGVNEICKSISELTNIPINKLSVDEKKKLSTINETLKSSVIGQDDAIEKICRVIKRNKIGLGNKNKPIATMLLVGKSGTGKTLIAKKLAEEIFGDANSLVRIDMSEYSEKNSVAKLTGAAPGYIGYDNGGQLTEAVKNKQYCVLLLDEIEKADQEVYNIFLQLFDEGRLTDSSGQIVNFKNTIILMTSNVGTKKAQDFGSGVGFVTNETNNGKSIIEKEIKNRFAPEFINRLDQIVYFNDLNEDNIKKIVKLEIDKLINRINGINFNVKYDLSVIDLVANECAKNKEYGARPILRFIQDNIEDLITDEILTNEYENNHTFNLSVFEDKITIIDECFS